MYSIIMKENRLAKRFIKTLKNKIYEYTTSVSKSIYIDKSDDIVNEYNNTYHRTIKMKPIDDNTYINPGKENNNIDPNFQLGDPVRISKYKQTFAKDYTPNCSKEVFAINKVKIQCHGHMLLMILVVKNLVKLFMKKYFKKQIKKNLG